MDMDDYDKECFDRIQRIAELDAENQRLREAMELSVEFLHRCEGAMALRELQTALEGGRYTVWRWSDGTVMIEEDCDKLDVAMEDKDEG